MKAIKIITAVVLCLALLAGCAGTSDGSASSDKSGSNASGSKKVRVTLPFSASDVLDPFTAKTKQNQELTMLLFDPLIKLDENYEPVCFLADKVEQSGLTLNIRLKSATFTDGTRVSADDVVYSLRQAMASGSNYADRLSSVAGVGAADASTVTVTMKHFDPCFINNLDFPIIKSGTASLKNDNNLPVAPIGCGRYTIEYDKSYRLKANGSYYGGSIKLKEISLVDCPDDDSLSHYMTIGTLAAVYSDLSNSQIPKMAGKTVKTATTNLVYIGANSQRAVISDSRLRLAVSFAVDRAQLCNKAYFEYAEPATSLFPSKWPAINGLTSIDSTQNTEQAVAYFNELGYNSTDSEGYLTNEGGSRLTLKLLYNSDNAARTSAAEQISEQLRKCGVFVNLVGADFERYKALLESGQFDLYIGEIRFSNSLDASALYSGSAVYGVNSEGEAAKAYSAYAAGEGDILSAVSGFVSDMPLIPLCYRCGVLVVSNAAAGSISYSISDVYNGIESLG